MNRRQTIWQTMAGMDIVEIVGATADDPDTFEMTDRWMVTRDPTDWQPYNPNAERDARIEAEGLYTDPIHQFTTFDEEEDDSKDEPAAPDFDL